MKIQGPGRGQAADRGRRTDQKSGPVSGVEFERALNSFLGTGPDATEATGGPSSASGAAPADALSGLLAAQEVGGPDDATTGRQRRDRLVHHGEDMLERLEDLRLGLLLGAIPKDRLMDLARTVRARREQGPDRQLDALLDEIELRAEVELAKLSRAGA
ncbi:flagellar assembly protein FliX [Roseospira navarrensis]|uniref:Flagellar assembly protein FliX n=2 Tax=Roseospira navarrensis TaxID=140058 RepID=A0A7X1ZCR0_9PROT|nr:flagellar assembly protein FliX [Roseospira navarrensis]